MVKSFNCKEKRISIGTEIDISKLLRTQCRTGPRVKVAGSALYRLHHDARRPVRTVVLHTIDEFFIVVQLHSTEMP